MHMYHIWYSVGEYRIVGVWVQCIFTTKFTVYCWLVLVCESIGTVCWYYILYRVGEYPMVGAWVLTNAVQYAVPTHSTNPSTKRYSPTWYYGGSVGTVLMYHIQYRISEYRVVRV